MSLQVFGLPVSRGVAIGRAVLVASSRVDVAHYFISPSEIPAEVRRLRRARDLVDAELEALKREVPADVPAELVALLDVHLMLLRDESVAEATRQWIVERHYNAEWALSAQLEVLGRQFDEMEDDYLRERKADIEQVVERLLLALSSRPTRRSKALSVEARDFGGEDPLVLVANDISPADMLQFKGCVFTGFVTDVGGRNSHTAIVARSLDIPAVVGAREASRLVQQDDWVIIDGDSGLLIVDPSPIVLDEYRFRQRQAHLERERLARLRHRPSVTLDGQRVELLANIELPGDCSAALQAGAEGVGLFRSEFLFMNREGALPDEEEQYEAYRSAVRAMDGLPVTIRTVDIGSDKPLDRMSVSELRHEHQLNPALGLRAIRWSLADPAMFEVQLRAVLRAAADGPVKLLFPMLSSVQEIRATLASVARVRQQLTATGTPFGPVELGAMIEVPAAVVILPTFLRHFDFVSLGTNDLIQYTLAIDRSDESVAHLYDPWHPAVLGLVSQTIRQAIAAGKGVCVCGETAGDPDFTEWLLAVGLRSFSMHPAQLPTIKQRILRADTSRLRDLPALLESADEPRLAWREWVDTRAAQTYARAA
ncbi:MAG TPA: phosphoenolpyruvate--protein phosphotransferase [Burkholderiaceae bacterium]|nr:phosphoenolpyruvate--protein phosphotransferase [Burkholderiaceae bacterium]HMZ00299.1 phosphoenolpyruvate--protein phosphotransferase [Burkholderiaceae bacterium]HNB44971.1 phosphoenolpyruvate--protein phosphotransferase [Burkholderiaceae bacterium]HNG79737.1 phosphoenolpyruvate--protein phosphotransferase [Burkholderiaceae bacterium]